MNLNERNALKKKLSETDFVIHEAVLYLDGHPNNKKALEYYKKALAIREELYNRYVNEVGPLCANDVRGTTWTWIDGWPWHNSGEGGK